MPRWLYVLSFIVIVIALTVMALENRVGNDKLSVLSNHISESMNDPSISTEKVELVVMNIATCYPPTMFTDRSVENTKIAKHSRTLTNCLNRKTNIALTQNEVENILYSTMSLSESHSCLDHELFCVNDVLYNSLNN